MQLSLLDRLTDAESTHLPQQTRYGQADMRRLKDSLRRDLEALLNSRRADLDIDGRFEHAANSVLAFGVVDFTSFNLNSNVDQERVRRSIEHALRQFEPRLARLSVTLEQPEPFHPMLNLQIEAHLRTAGPGETIRMEAALDRASRRVTFHRTGT